jgi:hypothetical protein
MRNWLTCAWLLCAATTAVLAVGCDGDDDSMPATASGSFTALTYNVAGLPEGLSGSHPLANTPLISPRLNAYDLVLVQESWQTPDPNPLAPLRVHHELLVADAQHPYKSDPMPLPLNQDPRRPTAIVSDGLNHFSQFPFGEVMRLLWPGCADSAADCLSLKGFSATQLSLAPDVTIDLYNLHMEAGGTPMDDTLREQGVRELAAFINEHSVGHAVLVGGDFNLHIEAQPDATTFQLLLDLTGLTDACTALGCPEPERIDKFLYRSSDTLAIEPEEWRNEDEMFQDANGEPLSDHEPVAVRFHWDELR